MLSLILCHFILFDKNIKVFGTFSGNSKIAYPMNYLSDAPQQDLKGIILVHCKG